MKVLIINSSDIEGGAARAVYRIHQGLVKIGIDSYMLVQKKMSLDKRVITIEANSEKIGRLIRPKLDQLPIKLYKKKKQGVFSTGIIGSSKIIRIIRQIDPDIIHLHWINQGFISIKQIGKLEKPIVWSLLDMWPFTGGCHYDNFCGKYVTKCRQCPMLGSNSKWDLSSIIFKKKCISFSKIRSLNIVGHSKWLAQCAKDSHLFKSRRVENIPSIIDTDKFNPVEQKTARDIIGINKDKKVILFGALSATTDPRKGFQQLINALKVLKQKDLQILVFGGERNEELASLDIPIDYIEMIQDDITLKLYYSAADVTVVPSLQENLSNIILESMACGTPVVAFNIGGNPDMIDHKVNGYLSKSSSAPDLALGIEWILQQQDNQSIKHNCLLKISEKFSYDIVAKEYNNLYLSLISNSL